MSRKQVKDPSAVRREAQGAGKEEVTSTVHIIEVNRTIRGRHYQANLVFNVPSIQDQIKIGQMKAIYLPGGATADPNAAMLVEQICYLEVCLDDPKPEWWKPLDFMEADLLAYVYNEGVAYANTFLGRDAGVGSDSEEDGGSDGGGDDSVAESDVGQEVQPPNESSPTVIHDTKGAK